MAEMQQVMESLKVITKTLAAMAEKSAGGEEKERDVYDTHDKCEKKTSRR